jgi:hypothetical protein
MSEERLARIESTLHDLVRGQETLEKRLTALDERTGELRTHMGVLHEDVIDRIQAIADPTHLLRREMRAGDAAVLEACDRRLTPLELAVREHSTELKKRRRRNGP